ncbi:MAG: hypothetical protein AAGG01_07290, partial [Planctomycetota bacterium]
MESTRILARLSWLSLSLPLSVSALGQAPFDEPETFAEHRDFSTGLVALDANVDGYDGVIACTINRGVWHYESTGNGQARLGVQLTEGDMRHPLVHDVDGDGAPDVLGTIDGVGVVMFRNRAGRFDGQDVLAPGDFPLAPRLRCAPKAAAPGQTDPHPDQGTSRVPDLPRRPGSDP